MKTVELPSTSKSVHVAPRQIEVALSDDPALAPLLLPPLEDMKEIAALRGKGFSLADNSAKAWSIVQDQFAEELSVAESKADLFADAPAYIFRLADLALLAGNRQRELEYLKRARTFGHEHYAARRIGENLIADGAPEAAEEVFRSADLERDDYANLRLAYFHVLRKEFDKAQNRVAKAAEIAPLSFSVRLFEGALFLAGGEYYRAIRSFRLAEEERPNSSSLQTRPSHTSKLASRIGPYAVSKRQLLLIHLTKMPLLYWPIIRANTVNSRKQFLRCDTFFSSNRATTKCGHALPEGLSWSRSTSKHLHA